MQGGIEVQEFHGMNNENSYIITYEKHHWKVSEFVADVVMILKETDSIDVLTNKLLDKYDKDKIDPAIAHTINFLKKNSLILGEEQIQSRKHNNTNMCGRITLLPACLVSRIKIFCLFFFKPILLILSLLSFFWILYALTSYSIEDLTHYVASLSLSKALLCYGVMMVIGLFHELGHATALIFNGEKPGRIGLAFYMLSFVMFSDVTNAWKLKKSERFIVDYGGIYFQCVFSALLYIINSLFIHNHILNIVAIIEAISILGNFNPFFKYDGYWMLCDIFGASNAVDLVIKYWKNFFNGKRADNRLLPQKFRLTIIIYTIGASVFIIYFVKFTYHSTVNAICYIYSDIQILLTQKVNIDLTVVLQYISDRFTAYLILILLCRLSIKEVMKITRICRKKRISDGNDRSTAECR